MFLFRILFCILPNILHYVHLFVHNKGCTFVQLLVLLDKTTENYVFFLRPLTISPFFNFHSKSSNTHKLKMRCQVFFVLGVNCKGLYLEDHVLIFYVLCPCKKKQDGRIICECLFVIMDDFHSFSVECSI